MFEEDGSPAKPATVREMRSEGKPLLSAEEYAVTDCVRMTPFTAESYHAIFADQL